MKFKLILALVLIGLVLTFVLQNVAVVEIQFLLWSIALPRALVLFLVLAVGLLCGWLLGSHQARRRSG